MGAADLPRRAAAFLDFLLPPGCAGCGGQTTREDAPASVCLACRLGLPPVPQPTCARCGAPSGTGRVPACLECADWPSLVAGARAVCLLESPARELVHALKYQGWKGVGDFMGKEMARRAGARVREAEAVVPVPTSRRNQRRRGYNQARVIAAALADVLDLPLLPCLERRRQTGTQTTLNPAQRRANVSGAFVLAEGREDAVAGRRVVLVDDVVTTGATIRAASLALAPGEPASVFAYAFARTAPVSQELSAARELAVPEVSVREI